MNQTSLGLLFGGRSPEHEVSLRSASAVADRLSHDRYQLRTVGIDRKGDWFLYDGPVARITDGSWREDDEHLRSAILGQGGLFLPQIGEFVPLSVVFPALHGAFCEDGRLQGLLDLSGIPYVGCGTEVSAVCMNKAISKTLLARCHVPMANWICADIRPQDDPAVLIHRAEGLFAYPMFVKPARSGSSVGAGMAKSREDLAALIPAAASVDPSVMIERFISGREIEVAILDGEPLLVSEPGELAYRADFYDYNTKYRGHGAEMILPARIPRHTADVVRTLAERVFRALGCRHFARVDFFVTAHGEVYFNEINTLPGLTDVSMYPALMEHAGIPFSLLLDRLIKLAAGEQP